jgi:hypothetical protein
MVGEPTIGADYTNAADAVNGSAARKERLIQLC